ncbi:MAG: tRNA lysidine(34) synthetase TilS [Lachnospiraceae bacterium]|nr:tRNA lysidine(34) synthetase TilS [Lachnospiraceae bacterium]
MDGLEERVYEVIRKEHMIEPGERVLVGVSGGADSVCLFSVLLALKQRLSCSLTVVHVNHGMRPAAAAEEMFVERLAAERGVPFLAAHIDVPARRKREKRSPEDAARQGRYEAFARIMRETGADRLALAHNREDQAETVLFKLFRGTGLRGFAGMEAVRPAGEEGDPFALPLIRPLLYTSRREIEAYLSRKGLEHMEDDSNASDAYARNRIRRHLLPYAEEEIHAQAAGHLAAAAAHAREALVYIEGEAEKRYREILCGKELDVTALNGEPAVIKKEILFRALRDAGVHGEIGQAHTEALLKLISSTEGSRRIALPGGFAAERTYDRLRIIREEKEVQSAERITLTDGAQTVALPGVGRVIVTLSDRGDGQEIPADFYTKWFDSDKIKQSLCFRRRRQGDWIDVGNGRKSLKKEMIDRKIPAARRDGLWLLAAGDEILWIVGDRRCEAYRITDSTQHILKMTFIGDQTV